MALIMENALIGSTGFVGSTLRCQTSFSSLYHSQNIHEINGREFQVVVCAGAPGQKWIANREPTVDREKIDSLINQLGFITCKCFILISTVDVFDNPVNVDESTMINETGLQPYGLHRRLLEQSVSQMFPNHLIIRLPGLVGPGLRKNVIFDLYNKNNLQAIDSRSAFQFYPTVNLWYDIKNALKAGLSLLHLTAEPISVANISVQGFDRLFERTTKAGPVYYDVRTKYADILGSQGDYHYRASESIQAIRSYSQSETRADSRFLDGAQGFWL